MWGTCFHSIGRIAARDDFLTLAAKAWALPLVSKLGFKKAEKNLRLW
jgi:hypothetical protein